ncbi:hypothetical protein CDAR_567711 [Caerostris darwini]|uniref:Uncharacterized protein n=1 Tax=Caerostris darwini TaxID=1538125 RepID=A0AAV4WAP9_9ARAC|nr:hypothetical protein CDAR_567711 [Caerostris darwini]
MVCQPEFVSFLEISWKQNFRRRLTTSQRNRYMAARYKKAPFKKQTHCSRKIGGCSYSSETIKGQDLCHGVVLWRKEIQSIVGMVCKQEFLLFLEISRKENFRSRLTTSQRKRVHGDPL